MHSNGRLRAVTLGYGHLLAVMLGKERLARCLVGPPFRKTTEYADGYTGVDQSGKRSFQSTQIKATWRCVLEPVWPGSRQSHISYLS